MRLIFALVLLSNVLQPIRNGTDLDARWRVAEAIESVTADEEEARILMALAKYESSYWHQILDCSIKGDHGKALSGFQVQPKSRRERVGLCQSIVLSAWIALQRVRHSIVACSHLPQRHWLNEYTSGSCKRGHSASALRWSAAHTPVPGLDSAKVEALGELSP